MCFDTVLKGNKISISVIISNASNEFTEEDGCESYVDCITQPLEPNNIVLLNLVSKLTTKNFVGRIKEVRTDGYKTRYFRKRLIRYILHFVSYKLKTLE